MESVRRFGRERGIRYSRIAAGLLRIPSISQTRYSMFIDRAKIIVVSGAGGDGMVSFRREKYVPRGGPSGGDGGKGGSVFIKANSDLNTLINFRRHRKFAAKAGANGGAKEMFGKNAEDVFVEVPLGTMVYDNKTGELLADMTQNLSLIHI